jgi:hypothetical protein
VTCPNFTMTEDRKKEVSSMRRCPPIGTLAANLPRGFGTPEQGSYRKHYTTGEKSVRYYKTSRRSGDCGQTSSFRRKWVKGCVAATLAAHPVSPDCRRPVASLNSAGATDGRLPHGGHAQAGKVGVMKIKLTWSTRKDWKLRSVRFGSKSGLLD